MLAPEPAPLFLGSRIKRWLVVKVCMVKAQGRGTAVTRFYLDVLLGGLGCGLGKTEWGRGERCEGGWVSAVSPLLPEVCRFALA